MDEISEPLLTFLTEAQVQEDGQQKLNPNWDVDILVNCAGVMLAGTISGAWREDWRQLINLNLLSGLMYATCSTRLYARTGT